MHSRTKAVVTAEQLDQMLQIAGLEEVTDIKELTGGEFNLAFMVTARKKRYIIKIGPSAYTTTLTYEKNIMETELWAYEEIRKKTDIPIPDIIYQGHDVIGNHWFVMSVMSGSLLCDTELTNEERYRWNFEFGVALAKLHTIQGTQYGYLQNTMHDSWKEAYYDMVLQLIEDGEKQGMNFPELAKILRFIRKWEYVLDEVTEPCLIHFDLFSNNVFSDEKGHFAGLIDTERSFFGDRYADLVAINFLSPAMDNKGLIEGYNSISEEKLVITKETKARVALATIYLGLLMFIEGTTRLALDDPNHWRRKWLGTRVIEFAMREMDEEEC